MAGKCSQVSCYPEDTGCNVEGCAKLSDCKFYDKEQTTGEAATTVNEEMLHVPWTGETLGLDDLKYITASSPTILIGISGVASAGKTTFLAVLYCLLRHGQQLGDYRFCGSKTINGWENIAWYLSWKTDNAIQFPPHTSSNAGRVPGLLHMAVRNSLGVKKDLVFTDAPGEWFDAWSYNRDAINAVGADWIHKHADAFLLFADCEMLSGEEQGKARRQIKLVADRISEGLSDRPMGLIWSKSDIAIDSEMKNQISGYTGKLGLNNYKEFKTSVKEGAAQEFHQNILDCIDWLMEVLEQNSNPEIVTPLLADKDMFISKRYYDGSK
jgi:hypothetical protein